MAQLSRNATSWKTEYLEENVQPSSFGRRDNTDKAKTITIRLKRWCHFQLFIFPVKKCKIHTYGGKKIFTSINFTYINIYYHKIVNKSPRLILIDTDIKVRKSKNNFSYISFSELEISGIQDMRLKYKQNWINHLERMDNTRFPKHALNYKPRGRRDRGHSRKRWQCVYAGTVQTA